MTAAYTLAFLCLLRVDEVLKIQMHDIKFVTPKCIQLNLPFRKTHQNGGLSIGCVSTLDANSVADIPPFYLHALPDKDAHLCPVRAIAHWLFASKITYGYIFRKMMSSDRVSAENAPMVSVGALKADDLLLTQHLNQDGAAIP